MMKSHETTRKVMLLRRINHGRKYSWHTLSETSAFTYLFFRDFVPAVLSTQILFSKIFSWLPPYHSDLTANAPGSDDFLSLLVKANLHPLPPPPGASTSFHLLHHLLVSKLFLALLFKYLLSIVLHAPLNTYNIIYTHLAVFFIAESLLSKNIVGQTITDGQMHGKKIGRKYTSFFR